MVQKTNEGICERNTEKHIGDNGTDSEIMDSGIPFENRRQQFVSFVSFLL
jgi:hypothetical protein